MVEKGTIEKLFLRTIDAHLKGNLTAARSGYVRVLAVDPSHIGALQNMGALHLASGEMDPAIGFFQKVLRLEPDHVDALNNLGTALRKKGCLEEALESLQRAVRVDPRFCDAIYNLGNLHKEMGDYPKALDAYRRAIALDPAHTDARNNLAATLIAMDRLEEAGKVCAEALARSPRLPGAHYHMGVIGLKEGRVEAAAESFMSALHIDPLFPDALLNLGSIRAGQGKMEEAIVCFQKALSANPRSSNAYYNLGLAFERVGDLEGEISTQEAALAGCPDSVQSWIGAVRVFSKIADWKRVDALMAKIIQYPFCESETSLLSSILFMLHSHPMSDEEVFARHLRWGDHSLRAAARLRGDPGFDFTGLRRCEEKIRIGYVSPDFCRHSVGWFFREIALRHDPGRFEVCCYAATEREDDLTEDIRRSVASFSKVDAMNTRRLAEKIYRDRIHILVDLAGHTLGNRLDVFALRPAPIQVTMIGYPNGTGLKTVDYRISDRFAESDPSARCCLERHVYLQGFLPFYPIRTAGDLSGRDDPGFPAGKSILVSLNRAGKLRPEVLRLWDKILTRCPDAVLALGCGHVERKDLRENLLAYFALENRGKVFFLPRARTEEIHRSRYLQASLALDPFPYAGTTTSYEALALGVPVLTLVGSRHVQRTTYSLLRQLEIPETIAGSEEEYVEKAAALITHPELLDQVKTRLGESYLKKREKQPERYIEDLEDAFRNMWERYRRQVLP